MAQLAHTTRNITMIISSIITMTITIMDKALKEILVKLGI
jgi:hypothetical protein